MFILVILVVVLPVYTVEVPEVVWAKVSLPMGGNASTVHSVVTASHPLHFVHVTSLGNRSNLLKTE